MAIDVYIPFLEFLKLFLDFHVHIFCFTLLGFLLESDLEFVGPRFFNDVNEGCSLQRPVRPEVKVGSIDSRSVLNSACISLVITLEIDRFIVIKAWIIGW